MLLLTSLIAGIALIGIWLNQLFRKSRTSLYISVLFSIAVIFVTTLSIIKTTTLSESTRKKSNSTATSDSIIDAKQLEINKLRAKINLLHQEIDSFSKFIPLIVGNADSVKFLYLNDGKKLGFIESDLSFRKVYSAPDGWHLLQFTPNYAGTNFVVLVAKVADIDSIPDSGVNIDGTERKMRYVYKADGFLLYVIPTDKTVDTLSGFNTDSYDPELSTGIWCSFSSDDRFLMIHKYGAEFWQISFYDCLQKSNFDFPDTVMHSEGKKIHFGNQFPLVFSLDSKKYYARVAPFPPAINRLAIFDLFSGELTVMDTLINEVLNDSVFYHQGLSPNIGSWAGIQLETGWSPSGQRRAVAIGDTIEIKYTILESARGEIIRILPRLPTPPMHQRFVVLWK